jgi:hypothetical protein
MMKKQKPKHYQVLDGCVDDLIFTFGFNRERAKSELINALQEPLIKNRILSFVLMGNEKIVTAAGSSRSGCICEKHSNAVQN